MRTLALVALLALASPTVAVAGPADLIKLAQDRVDAAAAIYPLALARWQAGQGSIEEVAAWSGRWLAAVRDRPTRGKARKRALADHRDRMVAVAATARERVQAGTAAPIEVAAASYFVADAELGVARGK